MSGVAIDGTSPYRVTWRQRWFPHGEWALLFVLAVEVAIFSAVVVVLMVVAPFFVAATKRSPLPFQTIFHFPELIHFFGSGETTLFASLKAGYLFSANSWFCSRDDSLSPGIAAKGSSWSSSSAASTYRLVI